LQTLKAGIPYNKKGNNSLETDADRKGKRNRGHNYCKYCGAWILGGLDWKHDKRIEHLKEYHRFKFIKSITKTRISKHFSRDPVLPTEEYMKE
jgi:hypothetical protein